MANFFKNPLVLAETVIGSLTDSRSVILFEQPNDINQWLSSTNQVGLTSISNPDQSETTLGRLETTYNNFRKTINDLVDANKLKELFTGLTVPYLSKINGFNMYGVSYVDSNISPTSDLCTHPVETGEVITDNAILNPVKATVRIAMPTTLYTTLYTQIERLFKEKTYIMLQTKFTMYPNMVIVSMPYKMQNTDIDRPIIELQLEQVMQATTEYVESSINAATAFNAEDSDTGDYGREYADVISDVIGL